MREQPLLIAPLDTLHSCHDEIFGSALKLPAETQVQPWLEKTHTGG